MLYSTKFHSTLAEAVKEFNDEFFKHQIFFAPSDISNLTVVRLPGNPNLLNDHGSFAIVAVVPNSFIKPSKEEKDGNKSLS